MRTNSHFIAAHAIVRPLFGLTPGMWNFPRPVFVTGCIINGFFGLSTAFFTYQFDPARAANGSTEEPRAILPQG